LGIATEAMSEAQTAYNTLQMQLLPRYRHRSAGQHSGRRVGRSDYLPWRLHKPHHSWHHEWGSYSRRSGRSQCELGLPDRFISHRRLGGTTSKCHPGQRRQVRQHLLGGGKQRDYQRRGRRDFQRNHHLSSGDLGFNCRSCRGNDHQRQTARFDCVDHAGEHRHQCTCPVRPWLRPPPGRSQPVSCNALFDVFPSRRVSPALRL